MTADVQLLQDLSFDLYINNISGALCPCIKFSKVFEPTKTILFDIYRKKN